MPNPDASATSATIADALKANARAPRASSVRGAKPGAGGAASLVMGAMIALLCGATAAPTLAGERVAEIIAPPTPPNITGRWSGTPYALRHDPERCGTGSCEVVLDIVPCGTAWCGIEVKKGSECGGQPLQLTAHGEPHHFGAFKGRWSLAAGTQEYVVEANYRPRQDGEPERLYFVGDTGPELMIFRRSFPFQATLERVAEATCRATEKPVS